MIALRLFFLLAVGSLFAFYLQSQAASSDSIRGKVVAVTDGDTIKIRTLTQTHTIRLLGIDAPEKKQAFGTQAKLALSEKVFGKEVLVKRQKKLDRYGRVLGDVYLNSRWIDREMVAEGLAWHYKQYSKSPELAKAEQAAREAKLGLWQDKNPIPPWEFRRQNHKNSHGKKAA